MPPLLTRLVLSCLTLFLSLVPANAIATDNLIEVRSPHFTVYTPASEREARSIANQFEQIRALFHGAFPKMRTNSAQPVVILAVKGEKGMKELLPEQWEVKDHVHVAGLYQQGFDKNYVILQLNAEGSNPYHTLYHEYTHSLLHLNFSHLPLWLDEGLAEYLGNVTLGEKESRIGVIDPTHLYVLQQNRLIPIETLLAVEHDSPYYNESNRASVFYAESWAVVHYLLLNPDARQQQLMPHFLEALSQSHNQLEAARQSFGDLKKFGQLIEGYVRHGNFYNGLVKNTPVEESQMTARPVSSTEVLALRGDFFVHHNRYEAAKPLLEEATKQDPSLALPHISQALHEYQVRNTRDMKKEAEEAVRLGDNGFFPYYLLAISQLQLGIAGEDAQNKVIALLNKSIAASPLFAPSYDLLSEVYARSPNTQKQAISNAILAVRMNPNDLEYSAKLVQLLLNNNLDAEAKAVSDRVLKAAETPDEREMAQDLVKRVAQHKDYAAVAPSGNSVSSAAIGTTVVVGAETTNPGDVPGDHDSDRPPSARRLQLKVTGTVAEVNCAKTPEISLSVQTDAGLLAYHVTDVSKIAITAAPNGSVPACAEWAGHDVKLWFRANPGVSAQYEVSKLEFR